MQIAIGNFSAELGRLASANRHNGPLWVGLAGGPGCGKSTIAGQLKREFRSRICVIPMDGYHFRRDVLDDMNDPKQAHARRGAPFTFDSHRFVTELIAAKETGRGLFPDFDHATADPIEDQIDYDESQVDLVLVEGNYLLLDTEPWCQIPLEVFDLTCWLDVPIDACCERIHQRNLTLGIPDHQSQAKVEHNDRLNAELVFQSGPTAADWIVGPS